MADDITNKSYASKRSLDKIEVSLFDDKHIQLQIFDENIYYIDW